MSELLRGNFKVAKELQTAEGRNTVEDRFEREALKKLGGSIAFVSKRKVMWGDEPKKDSGKE